MAQRRLQGLQRVLGVNALFATAYGNVGSSIYYALGLVAGLALGLTPLVFVITGIFFFCTAATYAEATAMFPEAGGSSSFARHAFNEFVSFFAAWAQMLNYVITVAISAFFVPHYIGGLFWDPLRSAPGDVVFAAGVIILLSLINVVGVKESAGLNIVLAVVDFFTQLLMVVVGAFLVFSPQTLADNIHLGVAPSWKDFLVAIPLGMIAYTGIETISNMAEEAKDEAVTIPKAIARVRTAVYAIYFTLPAIALSALPVTLNPADRRVPDAARRRGGERRLRRRPDPRRRQAAGPRLPPAARRSSTSACSRRRSSSSRRTPGSSASRGSCTRWASTARCPTGCASCTRSTARRGSGSSSSASSRASRCCPGQAEFLGNMYAFGAMLSFTIAHAAVIRMRVKHPDVKRPYRMPGNITFGGRDIPGFAVFGGIATALSFLVVTALHPEVAIAGVVWLSLGIGVYVFYRRRQGLDLVTTAKIVVPQPVTATEAEYQSVLLALEVDHFAPQIVATAQKLAARGGRGIYVIVLITVPQSSPIDAELPEREAAAASVIEHARRLVGRRLTGRVVKIRAGQGGRVIIDEARTIRSQAIVLPLPPRTGTTLFGKTVETVLAERPCRVIIESEPSRV